MSGDSGGIGLHAVTAIDKIINLLSLGDNFRQDGFSNWSITAVVGIDIIHDGNKIL